MPYLNITTNAPVNKRQKRLSNVQLAKQFFNSEGKEELLMVNFEDCASLSLSGDFQLLQQ